MRIQDIVKRNGDFLRFHIHDCSQGTFALIMEEKPWTEKWGTTIRIEVQAKRLQQLADEILNYFNRKAKLQEWKPTIDEIVTKVQDIYTTSGLRYYKSLIDALIDTAENQQSEHKYTVDEWFINWIREAVTLKREGQIKEAQRIYEWLKSNENWLYRRT